MVEVDYGKRRQFIQANWHRFLGHQREAKNQRRIPAMVAVR
jgi:hypothetical protein